VQVAVTPVTLIGRNGPFPSGPPEPDGLPGAVDVRQASLLGGAWTAGAIRGLARGGADSVTWYETTGWRGVVERDGGCPMPERFPSAPGDAFPAFHVLADAAEWKAAETVDTTSDAPSTADALLVRDASGVHGLAFNITPDLVRVRIGPLPGDAATIRVLDDASAGAAARDPEAWRAAASAVEPLADGHLRLVLPPYAVARIDVTATRQEG
jgi:hypothetical protein